MTGRRMLVTGAAGMVGSYVPRVFADYELILTDIAGDMQRLDVSDDTAVKEAVRAARPDVVLHLAAMTDVDRCEQEPDLAFRVNSEGTEDLVRASLAAGSVLVVISSGAVFWGDKADPYWESDEPRPRNVYGQSKLRAELAVTSLMERFYIIRSGWMIGGGCKDKKFVGKITRMILEGRKHLRVVDDKFGSPTYAKDLLGGIRALLAKENYGLYHLVNNGMVSRYEIACAIQEIMDCPNVTIEPVSSSEFPLPAPRGRSEALANHKLDTLGLYTMTDWREALGDYLLGDLVPALKLKA